MGRSPAHGGSAAAPGRRGGGNRTKLVAILAASAVVVAAGVTGFLVLGGDKDDTADGGSGKNTKASASTSGEPGEPTASASDDDPRGEQLKPTIKGWKVVVNPKWGTAFDVPPDWEVRSPGWGIGFEDEKSDDGKPLIMMSA